LPLLLTLFVLDVVSSSRQAVLATAQEFRRETAVRVGREVEAYRGGARQALADVQALVARGALDPDDTEAVETQLFAALLRNPDLDELTLTRADGTGFDADGWRTLAPVPRWQLSLVREGPPDAPRLVSRRVVAAGGAWRAERRERPAGGALREGAWQAPPAAPEDPTAHPTFRVPASRDAVAEAAGDGPGLWSDLHPPERDAEGGRSGSRLVVTVMRVLERRDGHFLGVLRAGLARDRLDRLAAVGDAGALAGHRLFLCDEQGRLLTRLAPSDVLREEADAWRVAPASPSPELEAALAHPALAEVSEASPHQAARFEAGGRAWLVTYLALAHSQGWRLGILVPEDRYTGALAATRMRLVGGGALLVALAAAGGALALRALRRGLGAIRARTARMRAFDFTAEPARAGFRDVTEVIDSLEQAKTALRALGRYAPLDLVRQLYELRREPELGGEEAELTILFSDVAGFTGIAERMPPDVLARLLGRYLEELTGVIHAHRGVIDKYVGDAVMALWNAPAPCADHAAWACRAVLACREALARLQASPAWAGRPALETRFGIHSDRVLVGHFGAPERLSYTALGDGVNLASRLEGLNKQYGTNILVSGAVRERLGGRFVLRRVDSVAVKGRAGGVEVFELLAEGAPEPTLARQIAAYERAFDRYRAREFAAALAGFELLAGDPPAAALATRCRQYLSLGPPPEWDGTFVAREK
jgi:adenylate cyclase